MKTKLLPILAAAASLGLAAPVAMAETLREDARDAKNATKEAARDAKEAAKDVARDARDNSPQPVKDAFIHGKIVSALAMNSNVSAYEIDVDVDNGIATLKGEVDSKLERDLAAEIARDVDGVTEVRSQLTVKSGARETARKHREEARRSLGQTLDDAGTTAAVKSKLLANDNTSGLKIDVDTKNGVVTLSGKVASEAEKDLAGYIARNSSDVAEVRNELTVSRR